MKAIQKELGEIEDAPNEIADLEQKIEESGMPEDARGVFRERYLRGMSARVVARRLGISENAAKQRAFRARRAVQRRLSAVVGSFH